jgi:glycine oxidase
MTPTETHRFDALVAGGGVIGLACAWRAAKRGLRVCVIERDRPASGASAVAAGMLAPAGEASWGEEGLLAFNLAALRRWPGFAQELESDSGQPVGFNEIGALHVALDRDESEELRRRFELHQRLELGSEWLRGRECRELEPGLAPAVGAGLAAPREAAVDPSLLIEALLAAIETAGVELLTGSAVTAASRQGDSWTLTTGDGTDVSGAALVLATGAWSGSGDWLPAEARPPVRPVKGEILTLRERRGERLPALSRAPTGVGRVCERIIVGERVYLVPRGDGRVIVGATVEEAGFDDTVTAGGAHELLREAYRVLPDVAEMELMEARAGLRPGSPDNAPLIGHGAIDGLIVATGHHRNGFLQAPATADAVAALLAGEPPAAELEPFSPRRFERAPDGSGHKVGAR